MKLTITLVNLVTTILTVVFNVFREMFARMLNIISARWLRLARCNSDVFHRFIALVNISFVVDIAILTGPSYFSIS